MFKKKNTFFFHVTINECIYRTGSTTDNLKELYALSDTYQKTI